MRRQMLVPIVFALVQLAAALCPDPVRAQAGFEDDRVMLQGFYWESYRHGYPETFQGNGAKRWYRIVAEQAPAIRAGRFATVPGRLETASSVFDFMTMFHLKDHKSNYAAQYESGRGIVGDSTDGYAWKNRAVTFLENHDTGFRTNEDGTPQQGHASDNFANGWEVEQGYAHILTHPGLPTVYWKHYFDWGHDLADKIRALINARKVAGVHAGSVVHLQDNARAAGVYAARIVGRVGDLYVRIGGDDAAWQPFHSGYQNYREYAHGAGWTVWVGLPGNPAFREAPLKPALPVPAYQDPQTIDVPDQALN